MVRVVQNDGRPELRRTAGRPTGRRSRRPQGKEARQSQTSHCRIVPPPGHAARRLPAARRTARRCRRRRASHHRASRSGSRPRRGRRGRTAGVPRSVRRHCHPAARCSGRSPRHSTPTPLEIPARIGRSRNRRPVPAGAGEGHARRRRPRSGGRRRQKSPWGRPGCGGGGPQAVQKSRRSPVRTKHEEQRLKSPLRSLRLNDRG